MTTTALTIRDGDETEIASFPLYDEANDGDDITVGEQDGRVVAYAMHTGNIVYFLESCVPGAGSALVRHLQATYEELVAVNCIPTSQAFWAKMGFTALVRPAFAMRQAGIDMEWFRE